MSPLLAKLRQNAPRLLLLVGAAGAAYVLVPHVPHERAVTLELDDPASVTAVEVAWSTVPRDDAPDPEPFQGGTWRFAAGQAPARLSTAVRAADGRYALDVSVERSTGREHVHKVMTLGEGGAIHVRVR